MMTSKANNIIKRSKTRRRARGLTTVEMVLSVAAIMGCFVYPLSQAMRSTGKRIAQESERGQDAMLTQAK